MNGELMIITIEQDDDSNVSIHMHGTLDRRALTQGVAMIIDHVCQLTDLSLLEFARLLAYSNSDRGNASGTTIECRIPQADDMEGEDDE